jgi:hypothetical protein
MDANLTYNVLDDELARFHKDQTSLVRIIAGCVGSGKSTATQVELFMQSLAMPPQKDKVRRSRHLITRTTYRDLERSALATSRSFFGRSAYVTFSGAEPWVMTIKIPILADGTSVHAEFIYMAVDELSFDKLKSVELTSALINEISDYQTSQIINTLLTRIGRYPSKEDFPVEYIEECAPADKPIHLHKPLYKACIVADFNPPNEQHWLRGLQDEPPNNWAFFEQNSPLIELTHSPDPAIHPLTAYNHANKAWFIPNPACNFAKIHNAGYQYWLNMVSNAERWTLDSAILGKYSTSISGKAVYPMWNEDSIIKTPYSTDKILPRHVILGIDSSGLHPAAVFMTYHEGTLYCMKEVVVTDTTFPDFIEEYVLPIIQEYFSHSSIEAVLDPSNPRSATDKASALDIIIKAGISARLAPTNAFGSRKDAVIGLLNKRTGVKVFADCKVLIEGFRGLYRYAPMKGQAGMFKPTPDKTTSHADVHDALQYGALVVNATANSSLQNINFNVKRRRAA